MSKFTNMSAYYHFQFCYCSHRVFCFCRSVKWNLNDESKHYQLNILENISTSLVFIIVVVNIFITAFGVQRPNTGA